MKRLALFLATAWCMVAQADWQTFLRDEPTRQKRDDRVFVTLDRLFKAEREADAADRPYLALYATLVLERAQWQFRAGQADLPVPTPGEGSCQTWSREQAQAFLRQRAEAALADAARYAATPAAPFLSATQRDPSGYDTSALAVLWQNVLTDWEKDDARAAYAAVLKAARDTGDDTLEGTLRLLDIQQKNLPPEAYAKALKALDTKRVWPANVRAILLREQAACLPVTVSPRLTLLLSSDDDRPSQATDQQVAEWLRLLTEARDVATDHDLKAIIQMDINEVRRAEVQVQDVPNLLPVGEKTSVRVRYRNTQTLDMRVDDGAWQTIELPQPEPYRWNMGAIDLPALPAGSHTLDFRVPQRFRELRETIETVNVTAADFTAARIHTEPFTVFVADNRTGAPIAGAEVWAVPENNHGEATEAPDAPADDTPPAAKSAIRTNALGLATLPDQPPDAPRSLTVWVSWKGQTIKAHDYFPRDDAQQDRNPICRLFSDRALYRPGDTVHLELIALRRDDAGHAVPDPKAKGTLRLLGSDASGKSRKLATFPIRLSATGSFSAEFALPKDFLGTFRAEVREWHASTHVAQVAAFKAPTFTVTLRRANPGAPASEPLRFAGTAHDLTETPLAGAEVAWTVRGQGDAQKGTATVGTDGTFTFEATLPEPGEDQHISAEASVLDTTGERQSGQTAFWLPRWGYDVTIAPDDWAIAETPFNVKLTAERAVSGTLAIHRDDATNILRRIAFSLRETEPGKAEATVPVTLPGGSYTLISEAGPVTNATGAIVLPRDGDFGVFPKDWRFTGALLRLKHNRDLNVGDTLEGFAAIAGDAPAFLVLTDNDGLRSIRPLTDGPFFAIPIEADLAPAFTLSVYGFEGATLRTASQTVTVTPPPELTIKAVRMADVARPGSAQTWELEVNDPSAELVVTCYDKALDALVANDWRPFSAEYCRLRYWFGLTNAYFADATFTVSEPVPDDFCDHVRTYDNIAEDICFRVAAPASGMRGAAVMAKAATNETWGPAVSDSAATPLPRVRTDFAKTALWAPQKRLVDGRAVFTFTLPDTLTTWKLMAFAFTPDGRSGTFTRDCVARQDVMLRPYLPRALRVGDRLTLKARLTNATDKRIETEVVLNRTETRPVVLPPKGSATVAWDVAAPAVPGTQTFEFATEGDAVRFEIPVQDNRVEVEDVYPLTLIDTKPTSVDVAEPAHFRDIFTRLDNTPVEAVAQSLAAVPNLNCDSVDHAFAKLAASLLLRKLGQPLPEADAREDLWLDRLLAARVDVCWPWFPGGRADPDISAEICIGVARLHLLKTAPKPLEEAVRAALAKRDTLPFAAWAYARAAFADVWPLDEDLSAPLLDAYLRAGSVQERRLLAIAAARLGLDAIAKQGLQDVLDAANRSDAWGLWWPQERTWWHWWHTPIESHALGLELLAVKNRPEDARAAARWLLQHRRLNDWGTARATLAAAHALLLVDAPETRPSAVVAPKVAVQSERLPGVRRVTLTRAKPGLTFGSIVARYALPLAQIPPPAVQDAALTLSRAYTPANPKTGDTVTVRLTLTAAQPMSHLHLRDDRPANTEPLRQLPWWDWQSAAYITPDDTGLDLYIATLPRGVTVIEYQIKATHAGTCLPGLATLRALYAPDFAARTATAPLTVAP